MAINIWKPLKTQLLEVSDSKSVEYALKIEVFDSNENYLERFGTDINISKNKLIEIDYLDLFKNDEETLKILDLINEELFDYYHSWKTIKKNINRYFELKGSYNHKINIYFLFYDFEYSDVNTYHDDYRTDGDRYYFNGLVKINDNGTYTYTGKIQIDFIDTNNWDTNYISFEYSPRKYSEPITGTLKKIKSQYRKDLKQAIKEINQELKEEYKNDLDELDPDELQKVYQSWKEWKEK